MKLKWFNLNEDGTYSLKNQNDEVKEEVKPKKEIKEEIKEEPKKRGRKKVK